MDQTAVAYQFSLCAFALRRNLDGLSQAESLKALPMGANNVNWIVGHVVRVRNRALALLGRRPLFADGEFSFYEPARSASGSPLPLEELVRRFGELQSILVDALASVPPDVLGARAPVSPTNNPNETIGSLLASLAFHESYHMGQLGIARRLLGKRGAILAPGEPLD
jgi:hypothetical protein